MECIKSVFIKNGRYYIITKDKYETREKFNERSWFIINSNPKTEDEFEELIILSRIWVNIKFNDAIYPDPVMEKIKKYIN